MQEDFFAFIINEITYALFKRKVNKNNKKKKEKKSNTKKKKSKQTCEITGRNTSI